MNTELNVRTQQPTGAFVFASWVALLVGALTYTLMASPNSPTRGHPKFPQAAQPDYDVSGWMAKRAAASLSL